MATLLRPDGTSEEVQPANRRDFQLKELYQHLECDTIEVIPTKDGRIMIIDEEGKLADKSRNEQATALINFPSSDQMREIAAMPNVIFVGDLDQADYVVGIALVCKNNELR
jgi:hypothetical protein